MWAASLILLFGGNATPAAEQTINIPQIVVNSGSANPVVTNSIITYGQYGSIADDPSFVDPANNNYHLNFESPAINAGNNDFLISGDTIDLVGNHRIIDDIVDIGAYETVANKIVNNGDSAFVGMNGSLNVTGTSFGNNQPNIYKWKVKSLSNGIADSMEINLAYSTAYQSVMQAFGITLDSMHFEMSDLSKLPLLMNIISPGSEDYWNNFTGNIYLSRVINPANDESDSVISNILTLHIASALPVTIFDFTGQLKNGNINLQWQTGVESNFSHFEIDKSTDGKTFAYFASVQAKGNNSNYTFSASQSEVLAYYRLKSIDNDGSSVIYPKIISLSQTITGNLQAYPNPATDHINIKVANAGILSIFNVAGKLVKTQSLQAGLNNVVIQKLSAGVYFGSFNGQRFKFIKN